MRVKTVSSIFQCFFPSCRRRLVFDLHFFCGCLAYVDLLFRKDAPPRGWSLQAVGLCARAISAVCNRCSCNRLVEKLQGKLAAFLFKLCAQHSKEAIGKNFPIRQHAHSVAHRHKVIDPGIPQQGLRPACHSFTTEMPRHNLLLMS